VPSSSLRGCDERVAMSSREKSTMRLVKYIGNLGFATSTNDGSGTWGNSIKVLKNWSGKVDPTINRTTLRKDLIKLRVHGTVILLLASKRNACKWVMSECGTRRG